MAKMRRDLILIADASSTGKDALPRACTARIIRDHLLQGAGVVPAEQSMGVEAQAWMVQTKYYTAELRLGLVLSPTASVAASHWDATDAIVLVVDSRDEAPCALVESLWLPAVARHQPEIVLLLDANPLPAPAAAVDRLRTFAVDNQMEWVEMCAGDGADELGGAEVDKVGVERVREALCSHVWPGIALRGGARVPTADDVAGVVRGTLPPAASLPRAPVHMELAEVAVTMAPSPVSVPAFAAGADTAEPRLCGSSVCMKVEPADKPFKVCGRCRRELYCSPDCQKVAWKSGHKHACVPVTSHRPATPTNGSSAAQLATTSGGESLDALLKTIAQLGKTSDGDLEANDDAFGTIVEQMKHHKLMAGTLPDAQRREYAEKVALAFARAMDICGDGDSDDPSDDPSDGPSDGHGAIGANELAAGVCGAPLPRYVVGSGDGHVYLLCRAAASGALTVMSSVCTGGGKPMFCAQGGATRNLIYTVRAAMHNEAPSYGELVTLSLSAANELSVVDAVPSHGVGPCHVVVDRSGDFLLVAHYESGHVAVVRIAPHGALARTAACTVRQGTGTYRADGSRQDGAHPHHVLCAPDNRHVLVCDLGLDRVCVYAFDSISGMLTPVPDSDGIVPAGAGPRHACFCGPDRVAVVNELDNTVVLFQFESASGKLKPLSTASTLSPEMAQRAPPFEFYTSPSHAAEIAFSAPWLLVSNRGADTIATLRAERDRVTLVGQCELPGRIPWHFDLFAPDRAVVCWQHDAALGPTGGVCHLTLAPTTGILTVDPSTSTSHCSVPLAMCVHALL